MSENNSTSVEDIDVEDIDWSEDQGSEAAKAAAKTGPAFNRVDYLQLDGSSLGVDQGKDRVYLRYLTDFKPNQEKGVLGWITADHHTMVPTKPKPASLDADRKWPPTMSAVCRNDKKFAKKYGDCYICENIPDPKGGKRFKVQSRTWALAVLREPVIGDGTEENGGAAAKGKVLGYRDVTKEVAVIGDDGKPVKDETETVKAYIRVHQSWNNFYSALAALGSHYGTVLDRDFLVIRTGTGLDTEYQHIPMDPIDLDLGDGDSVRLDLREADLREALYEDMPDLRKEVASQATDDWYGRWFIPSSEDSKGSSSKSKGGAASTPSSASASKEPTADKMAALKNRIRQHSA